jgi:hypothetical protein
MKALLAKSFFVLALSTVLANGFLFAQNSPAPAPLPGGLSTAKTVFISDETGESLDAKEYSERPYNTFYAALKNWGHFQIVSSPAEADLILQFRITNYHVGYGLSATVLDTKNHVAIWALSVPLKVAARKGARAKNFDQAVSSLTNDLKEIVEEASKP